MPELGLTLHFVGAFQVGKSSDQFGDRWLPGSQWLEHDWVAHLKEGLEGEQQN